MFRRHGPLLVGTLLILGLVTFVTLYRSSPGELSKAHKAVAGSPLINDCKKCHAEDGMRQGCLECHTEIAAQLQHQSGFHEQLARSGKSDCGSCHSEHNGPAFALVNKSSWEGKDPSLFKHSFTTYTLTGAHQTLACAKCHNPKNHSAFSLPQFPKQVRPDTHLGLSQACIQCHADPHAGGFATKCTSCHSQVRWKPAPLFNHDKFYPLRGAHARAKCSECHTTRKPAAGASVHSIFGPVKGKRCADCHNSPHRTRWDQSCESCHQNIDKSWADADRRMTALMHAKTGFRLVMPHQKVSCAQCHGPATPGTPFNKRYPDPHSKSYNRSERDCEACHADAHRGQFANRYAKCINCHNVGGWTPTRFNVQTHSKTSYPLIGGHAMAACNKCHVKDSTLKTRLFAKTPTACAACHRDIHYGQFRQSSGTTLCESCHKNTVRWSKLVFNHETQSAFKLGEAHKTVACKDCHPLVTLGGSVKLVQYKPIKRQCSDCHALDELENKR